MTLFKKHCLFAALVGVSLGACGPPHERDQNMVRLAFKLGQPDRVLTDELSQLANQEEMSISSLKQATSRIIDTRAKFDAVDKTLAVDAVKFAMVEDIPIERSADLVTEVAYDLELGRDAVNVLSAGIKAEEKTPNLKGADAVQLVIDMKPYWSQVHRLTGSAVRAIVLDKAPVVMAIQKILYRTYPSDPRVAKNLLGRCGLSGELLTFESSYRIGSALQFSPAAWTSLVDRFHRGEVDVIFNEVLTGAQRLAPRD
jgi:hypothetical protein